MPFITYLQCTCICNKLTKYCLIIFALRHFIIYILVLSQAFQLQMRIYHAAQINGLPSDLLDYACAPLKKKRATF